MTLLTLAQNNGGLGAGGAIGSGMFLLLYLALIIVVIVGWWKVFEKAGHPGWAAIIPIYNAYILCKIAGRPGWWVILMFIPVVNLVIAIMALIGLAQNFGRGAGTAIGLLLLPIVFYPILAFGSARYQGQPA